MEFKELPTDVQKTAAHTLHSVLRDIGKDIETEPAKDLARNIKTAFIELYQVGTGSETIETKTVYSPAFTLKPEALSGEVSIEIASELLPVIRETIRRRGLDGSYDHDVLQVLRTMVTSLGI
ncbi:TPA: hypothetical protein OMT88_000469 [Enterobacter asburiae]|nr:hypothetical protein ABW49_03335 [Enterobacter asburiae]MBS7116701.1 hypothetical protein [Enterobacter cloacae]HBK4811991.1 hypothetical protein [Enterobacter asburiae]HCR0952780.1 hypothetical protein [Enterobacter asburiae]HDX4716543.1 hypothetical protein [Enterobacter asburiae]